MLELGGTTASPTYFTVKEGAEEACLSMITSSLLAFPVLIVISDANVREGKAWSDLLQHPSLKGIKCRYANRSQQLQSLCWCIYRLFWLRMWSLHQANRYTIWTNLSNLPLWSNYLRQKQNCHLTKLPTALAWDSRISQNMLYLTKHSEVLPV